MNFRLIIGILIVASIIYGANLFVVWTHKCLLNDGMTTMRYLIPLTFCNSTEGTGRFI